MYVVRARNVHQALPELMHMMKVHGIRRESRNGPVMRLPGPCTIVYEKPCERVMFWRERAANPFFHLLESLWMLAGRNDVKFLSSIVSHIATFSDDGETFHGAYGHRWRKHFIIPQPELSLIPVRRDQLAQIAKALHNNPDCRRQVLSVWDGHCDLEFESKDLPCNTHVYFARDEDGRLDITVCNRSNDAIWGALGANAVHFSMLQEFMAGWIGCEVGKYWQMSNNMHLYLNQHEQLMHEMSVKAFPSDQYKSTDPYAAGLVTPTPLLPRGDIDRFQRDNAMFLDAGVVLGVQDSFIRKVAGPMRKALDAFKNNDAPYKYISAKDELQVLSLDSDWGFAANDWIDERRRVWELSHTEFDE